MIQLRIVSVALGDFHKQELESDLWRRFAEHFDSLLDDIEFPWSGAHHEDALSFVEVDLVWGHHIDPGGAEEIPDLLLGGLGEVRRCYQGQTAEAEVITRHMSSG